MQQNDKRPHGASVIRTLPAALAICLLAASAAIAQPPAERIRWRFQMDSWLGGQFIAVGPNGTVYASDLTKLYALTPDGELMSATADVAVTSTDHSASNRLDGQAGCLESSNIPHDRKDWWTRVQRGLSEAEYHAGMTDQGLQAPNRAHNLRAYFEPGGVRIHDRTAVGPSELVRLSLVGLGRGSALVPVAMGKVTQAGVRVEIRRPGVVEWYENSAHGLEQGFTLAARPAGTGPLMLELGVDSAQAVLHRDSVVLTTNTGRRLRYGSLAVEDARGQTIASHFDVPSPNRVRLIINDTKAVYPLVINSRR